MLNCACRDFYNAPRCTPTGLCAPSQSPPIRCTKLSTLHAWTGDCRPTDQIKHCMCFVTVCLCECVLVIGWSLVGLPCVDETLGAGHDTQLLRALTAHSSLFSPFMCEIDCAICAIQMDELMLVLANRARSALSFIFSLFSTQAEKEKLQQAGDGNFERIFLLAPQQPVSERGGQRRAS